MRPTSARPGGGVDTPFELAYLAPPVAPSSNGKTTDSDSVNRGSNPRGASSRLVIFQDRPLKVSFERRIEMVRRPDAGPGQRLRCAGLVRELRHQLVVSTVMLILPKLGFLRALAVVR